jgi:hypothetical protein
MTSQIQSSTPQVKFMLFYFKACPICVTLPSTKSRPRFVLLADHISTVHDDGNTGIEEDGVSSPFITQTRHAEVRKQNDNDEDDDDDNNNNNDDDDDDGVSNDVE